MMAKEKLLIMHQNYFFIFVAAIPIKLVKLHESVGFRFCEGLKNMYPVVQMDSQLAARNRRR
jgi:hypothetical protein